MSRFLLDAVDLGINDKGIHRVLSSLVPAVRVGRTSDEVVVATTAAGLEHIGGPAPDVLVVPAIRKSAWEQWGLPRTAAGLSSDAVYSHREAGALWGAPLVLHVPEDPEVRWARETATTLVERSRRAYSRALMGRSLRRAAVVAASVPSVAAQLAARHGVRDVRTIPLGVDLTRFRPATTPREDVVFHLGSPDPRDRTKLVVRAYAAACQRRDLPPLVVAGSLGEHVGREVAAVVRELDLGAAVRVTGRVDDAELGELYRNALVVVQPATDEGFGLQPLEALASGAPLLVADTPAVRDVVGGAAVLVPAEAGPLADGLVTLAGDSTTRGRLRSAGPAAASTYTWAATARHVLEALGRAAGSP